MAGSVNTIPTTMIHDVVTGGQIFNNEAGSIVAGCRCVSVKNIGAADGTFDGLTIAPNEVFNYPWPGFTYGEFEFDATGTSLKIITTR